MPRLPGDSRSVASTCRPNSVRSDGEGTTEAPQVSMSARRYGFCWYDTLTMYTITSMSKKVPAKASADPHCPAPVSVVSRLIPSSAL